MPVRSSVVLLILLALCGWSLSARADTPHNKAGRNMGQTQLATFAGGCFWCMEPPFEKLEGVVSVRAGYTGGRVQDPTYEQVSGGSTGHAEAVEVIFDPSAVSYDKLLEVFWQNIDPTTPNQQFADHGSQYRTGIFYHTEEQRQLAEASKAQLAQSGKFSEPIVTEITPASAFYPAEDAHQDYYKKQALQYERYKRGSGREAFLRRLWGHKAP